MTAKTAERQTTKVATAKRPTGRKPTRHTAEIVSIAMPRRIEVGNLDKIDTSTMGGRIEWARLRKGLRQEDLAQKLGKSRITVGAYESNQITPPITVVEAVAKVLETSPSYLAYGEQTVPVYGKTEIDVVAGPEMRIGTNGAAPISGFALSRDLVESFGVDDPKKFAAYVLNHDAPEFGLRSGDRMFVNQAVDSPKRHHDLYLLDTGDGIEVVRIEPTLSSKAGEEIAMTGPSGQRFHHKLVELNFLGAVVATLRRQ
jgi:transcriptional regulator with XRE-family HTH domain